MLLMPLFAIPLQHCAPDTIRHVITFSPSILGRIPVLEHLQPPGRQIVTSQLSLNHKFHAGPKNSTTATFTLNEYRFDYGAQDYILSAK